VESLDRSIAALVLVIAAAAAVNCGDPEHPPSGYEGYDGARSDAWRPDVRTIPIPTPTYDGGLGECGGERRNLSSSRAEIILVVDRSGSMGDTGADGVVKWVAMRNSMRTVLPRVQATVSMGLLAYPRVQAAGPQPLSVACGLPNAVDVAPAFNNSAAVLAVLTNTNPGGATPTNDALTAAAAYFDATPDEVGRRFLVLATDGGPNCNAALDGRTCRCVGTGCNDARDPTASASCLDDARTIATLRAVAARGVPTFVIGLPGAENFADVLNAMAVAGGRPREATPRYYTAANATQLTTAISTITSGITDCRFELAEAPPDPDEVDVRLGGTRLGRDVRHANGWDWDPDSMHRAIVFYGATCDRVRGARGGEQLVAAFGCPPAPAPE
jgi:hypothetical protein